ERSHPAEIFISYSHEDESWLEEIGRALRPIQEHKFCTWTDKTIAAGTKREAEEKIGLNPCDAALLLFSPAFIGSGFFREQEPPRLLDRARTRNIPILWILVRDSYVPDEIRSYQAVLDPKKPLDYFSKAKRATKLKQIAETIKDALNR